MAAAQRARSHPRLVAATFATLLIAVAVTLVWLSAPGKATSSGSPYDIPIATDTNPDATTFETTITAMAATVDVGAAATANAHAETFNGSIPGPTLFLNVNDTVIVHFVNKLDEPTGIHWHGIELPNEMDGTPLTQNMVPSDGTFLYRFKVLRPGIYWYHPHHHSSTNQVVKGLYGMIVVKDPNEDPLIASGVLPSEANTKQIVLSDTTVCKAAGNDVATYAAGLPWVGPAALPVQSAPVPKTLCQSAGDGGAAVDASGNPKPTSYALGDIPSIQKNNAGQENEGQTVLTNGKNVGGRTATQGDPPGSPLSALGAVGAGASLLNVQPGQGLRLQLVNASAIRYMRLRLTKPDGTLVNLVKVGGEGGLINTAQLEGGLFGAYDTKYDQGEILLGPGTRADVVAAIPTAPTTGVMTLWTQDFQRLGLGPNWSNIPTVPVMHLNLAGPTVAPAYTITGGHPAGGTPLRSATGDTVEVLPLTGTTLLSATGFAPDKVGKIAPVLPITLNAGGTAKIDTVTGAHDNADYATAPHQGPAAGMDGSTRYTRLGGTLQLTVMNNTSAHHPFHPHGFSIQPKTLTKAGDPTYTFQNEFRDNVDIPPGYTLTYRVRFDDRAKPDGTTPGGGLGRWVFHCHIFFHATLGMISELVVLPAGLPATNGNERPNINTNTTAVSVNQGQTASFTGTYNDINGGAVTLSSSVGTVTDNGGGNYSWSFPTGAAPSQYVYVNATDTGGASVQMPVQLTINNTPPALSLPAAQQVVQGANLAFNVSATDPDAPDPLALTASGLPAGASLTDAGNRTGSVSGQVTAEPGDYNAQFFADDQRNAPVSSNLKVTVTQPLFSAVISRYERLVKQRITVGCRFVLPSVTQCQATARRSGKQVGKATSTAAAGQASLNVSVPLGKAIRRAIARSVPGVPVTVALGALRPGNATAFAKSGKTRVVAPRARVRSPVVFNGASVKPNRGMGAFAATLAKQINSAKQIICTGHPNVGSNNKVVAAARGKAACAALQKAGVKATRFTSNGSTRKHTRRVDLIIRR